MALDYLRLSNAPEVRLTELVDYVRGIHNLSNSAVKLVGNKTKGYLLLEVNATTKEITDWVDSEKPTYITEYLIENYGHPHQFKVGEHVVLPVGNDTFYGEVSKGILGYFYELTERGNTLYVTGDICFKDKEGKLVYDEELEKHMHLIIV